MTSRTKEEAEHVIELFKVFLNNYGGSGLSSEEQKLFERHYDSISTERREFCDLFGADKILPAINLFLSDFVIRKVMSSKAFVKKAAKECERLSKWLGQNEYVSLGEAKESATFAAKAAKILPISESASMLLWEYRRRFHMRRLLTKAILKSRR